VIPLSVLTPTILTPAISGIASNTASSSVTGSLNFSTGTSSGHFFESDSSDGSAISVHLDRRGFSYDAAASAASGQAHARVATEIAPRTSGHGGSSANATSSWTDWFLISGGTGTATGRFATTLEGLLNSGRTGSVNLWASLVYSTGVNCSWWWHNCSEADWDQTFLNQTFSFSGRSNSTMSQMLGGEFVFEYDKPFKLTATLSLGASNGGSAEFNLSSTGSSLILPSGAMLAIGPAQYVQPVPEAETWAMMLAGLGLVGWMTVRRRRRV